MRLSNKYTDVLGKRHKKDSLPSYLRHPLDLHILVVNELLTYGAKELN